MIQVWVGPQMNPLGVVPRISSRGSSAVFSETHRSMSSYAKALESPAPHSSTIRPS